MNVNSNDETFEIVLPYRHCRRSRMASILCITRIPSVDRSIKITTSISDATIGKKVAVSQSSLLSFSMFGARNTTVRFIFRTKLTATCWLLTTCDGQIDGQTGRQHTSHPTDRALRSRHSLFAYRLARDVLVILLTFNKITDA